MTDTIFMDESIEDIKQAARICNIKVEISINGEFAKHVKVDNMQTAFQLGRAIGVITLMNELKPVES